MGSSFSASRNGESSWRAGSADYQGSEAVADWEIKQSSVELQKCAKLEGPVRDDSVEQVGF